MLHHVSIGTNDLKRSQRFYDCVLPVLGLKLMASDENGLGYGNSMMIFSVQIPVDGEAATVGNGSHICFAAENREMVDRFHQLALASEGTSDGNPGLRPEYDANYYGAFVRDPDATRSRRSRTLPSKRPRGLLAARV
jgi:catechol 2,3-dioxygenase-like lactoylglutathione lyase family enzyme